MDEFLAYWKFVFLVISLIGMLADVIRRLGHFPGFGKKSQVGQILCREPLVHFADLFITARGMLRGADIDR